MGKAVGKAFKLLLLSLVFMVCFIVALALLGDLAEPYSNEFPNCKESEECHFKATSSNVFGSGRYWYYGYDDNRFYSYILPESYNKPYLSIPIQGAKACQGFDEHDVLTWVSCIDLETDCDFVQRAKDLYENGSIATKGQERYHGSEYRDYNCQLP